MTDQTAGPIIRTPRWPWVVLGLGLVWTVLLRVPLIVNAEDHLDSDLAVDGLTLIDALHGQWRWHYPGTPHMGILPLFFSYPQAPDLGTQRGHAGERRDADLAFDRGGHLRAGVENVWSVGCGLGDSSACLFLDRHDLAIGTDHGRSSADPGLAHPGVCGTARLLEQGGPAVRGGAGALVRAGALPRYDVSLHAVRALSRRRYWAGCWEEDGVSSWGRSRHS